MPDTRRIDALKPYERNPRLHSAEQVEQIGRSLVRFGWTFPVLIDEDDGVIAGHGRIEAAKLVWSRGETIRGLDGVEIAPGNVPVIVARGWTDEMKRAYVIADNKLALNSDWDLDLLRFEIEALQGIEFDIEILGFGEGELGSILNPPSMGQVDPEDAPEPPETPTSRLGDVWLLGKHRIICGDSTDAETVTALLAGASPHLMVTDPPYGVEYNPLWRDESGINRFGAAVARGKVENDDKADWTETWALFPGDVAYVWHGGLHAGTVADNLMAAGFNLRAQIIWRKPSMVLSRGDYHWQHEPCWYAVRKSGKGHWGGDRKQTTIWDIAGVNPVGGGGKGIDKKVGHGTQKPVECMKRPIENNSKPGDAVYDPFSGSGTTIIAAEMTGRLCYAIELNPAYVDVAVRRWEAFTGQTARLESTGRTFADTAMERNAAMVEAD